LTNGRQLTNQRGNQDLKEQSPLESSITEFTNYS